MVPPFIEVGPFTRGMPIEMVVSTLCASTKRSRILAYWGAQPNNLGGSFTTDCVLKGAFWPNKGGGGFILKRGGPKQIISSKNISKGGEGAFLLGGGGQSHERRWQETKFLF